MKNYFKKMAALWVVGCLAAAGSLFALDLGSGFTLGGEVVGGVKVTSDDDGNTSIEALYDDWGDTLPRLRLNAAWSNDVFGVKGRLQVTDWSSAGGFGFGWINFGKYVTLYTGSIDDSHFGTGDVAFNKNVDSGDGFKLLIKPIEALTIGAYVPFNLNTDIEDAFGNMTIGASFKHQVVSVTAALKLGSVKKGTGATTGGGYYIDETGQIKQESAYAGTPEDYSGIGILFDVNAKPIPALGIDISGYFLTGDYAVADYLGGKGLETYNGLNYNGFAIAPRVTYSAGAISAYGQVKVLSYALPDAIPSGSGLKAPDTTIDIEVQGKYAVGKFAPYLRFGIGVSDIEKLGARVRVGTPFNLSDGLSFEVFDEIGGLGVTDGFKNTIRAQIKYTF
ncbi:MAG: hypothetical protein MdMp014T_0641 [Treponematales bacterium]